MQIQIKDSIQLPMRRHIKMYLVFAKLPYWPNWFNYFLLRLNVLGGLVYGRTYNRILMSIDKGDPEKKLLDIDRMVTVIDNKTREPIQKPICDIATSHTARKTFIGNLYKKVKDPNLVASLSGHTDGSRAFARYREIDNEMKRELVKLID